MTPQDSGDHRRFLRRAIALAREHGADGVHGPFGAVVVREGTIVGEGWNGVVGRCDPTAHAEVMAIRDAARRLGTHNLSGCVIYASCEPCPMCLAAIYWARLDGVHFAALQSDAAEIGFDDVRLYRELALDWPARALVSGHDLRDEGRDVLQEWISNPAHVDY
jgi:guanine deaminase